MSRPAEFLNPFSAPEQPPLDQGGVFRPAEPGAGEFLNPFSPTPVGGGEEFLNPFAGRAKAAPPVSEPSDFGLVRGVQGGLRQTQALFNAAAATAAQAAGLGDLAESRATEYARLMEDAARYDTVPFEEALDSPGKFATWAAEAIGEQVPNIGTALLTGGIGGIGARLAAQGALRGMSSELLEEAAKKWAQRGFAGGAYLGASTLETGGVAGEQISELGRIEPFVAAATGAASGLLELTPWIPVAGLLGLGPAARNTLIETLREGGMLSRITAGGVIGMSTEAATESLQELNAIAARRFVDENYDVLGPEASARVLEAAVTGGLVGGVVGAGAGALSRPRGPEDVGEEVPPDLPENLALPPPPPRLPPPVPPVEGEVLFGERETPGLGPAGSAAVTLEGEIVPPEKPRVLTLPGPRELPQPPRGEILGLSLPAPRPVVAPPNPADFAGDAASTPAASALGRGLTSEWFARIVGTEPVAEQVDYFTEQVEDIAAEFRGGRVTWEEAWNAATELVPLLGEASPDQASGVANNILANLIAQGPMEAVEFSLPTEPGGQISGADPLSSEGFERLQAAGLYMDPQEMEALFEGGPDLTYGDENNRVPDIRAAMSYNLPGGPTRVEFGTPLTDLEIAGIAETATAYEGVIQTRQNVWDAAAAMRRALGTGEITQDAYHQFLSTLENLELAVRPAELRSPYSATLPETGTRTVGQLWAHFENAQDDKVILALVMEELNPRGLESDELSIDMEDFWPVWKRYMPSLELVVLGWGEGSPAMQGLGLDPSTGGGLINGDLKRRARTAAFVDGLASMHELWIFRNPLIQFSHEVHAPGVYGNYSHVRVAYNHAGTPVVLEIQGDYDIHKGDYQNERRLENIQDRILLKRRTRGELRLYREDITNGLIRFREVPRDEFGNPEVEDVSLAAEIVSLDLQKRDLDSQIEVVEQEIRSLENELTQVTQNYRFAELNRGGNQAEWILQETLRALRLKGHKEALLANHMTIAQLEGWADHLYSIRRKNFPSGTPDETRVKALAEEESRFFSQREMDKLSHEYQDSGIAEQYQSWMRKYEGEHRKALEKFFRTGALGQALRAEDVESEANAVAALFTQGPTATFLEDRPDQIAVSAFAVSRYNNLVRRYKGISNWAKENHPGSKEEPFHVFLRDELKVLRIPLPEKWDDALEPIVLFRDQIGLTTGLPPRADQALRAINREIDEATGDHC